MKSRMRCFWTILIAASCWAPLALAEEVLDQGTATNVSVDVQTETVISNDAVGDLEPSVDVLASYNEEIGEDADIFSKQVFAEATSQNSGVANEVTNSGAPVVVTLADVATAELQQRAIIPSQDEKPQSSLNQTEETNHQQTDDKSPQLDQPNKDNLTEEIPSFSEWAQKRLEEAEKEKEPQNSSAQQHNQHANGKAKNRWKNYASLDCGAKVVASNPEAVSPSAILSPSRDEYKLNTCTSRVWFIVELCEAIQAKKIDFANFELFSSSPKDFTVSVSDRFPTREWSNVGQFTAEDERDIQSFDLHPHLFGKYIKVEVKSHYGSEHYCPISLFRVYGTSEFEVLQKEDSVHADRLEDDDDDDDESLDVDRGDSSKNLFSSATDAVISMVKKAAQVLGNKGNDSNQTGSGDTVKYSPLITSCTSPSHLVVCDNCSDTLFGQIYQILSCRGDAIETLLKIPLINDALINSEICLNFGFDFSRRSDDTPNSRGGCVKAFFSPQILGALCNTLAIIENKVVLNVSSSQYWNDTKTVEGDEIIHIETSEPHVIMTETKEPETDELPPIESTEAAAKSSSTSDISYTSQIKPTKTMTSAAEPAAVTESSVMDGGPEASSHLFEIRDAEVATPEFHEEPPVEPETATESSENLDDHLEHFISELNGDNIQVPTTASTTPQAQKESVFLRLSNRIKALERNMSLSGQYLEELSKRYKKQVEEMQKLLDKTVSSMGEEIRKKEEHNRQLEADLGRLAETVEILVSDRKSWLSTVFTVILTTVVTIIVGNFYRRKPSEQPPAPVNKVDRRKSIDVVTHSSPQKKRRRPSDQALKIVRSSMMANDDKSHVKRRKRKKQIMRSISISTLNEDNGNQYRMFVPQANSSKVWGKQPVDWVENEAKHIEEIPFVLEESEHSTLEPVDLVDKTPPDFAKKVRLNGEARKISVDETNRRITVVPSVNGELSVAPSSDTAKKERKGFKRIFKKVF